MIAENDQSEKRRSIRDYVIRKMFWREFEEMVLGKRTNDSHCHCVHYLVSTPCDYMCMVGAVLCYFLLVRLDSFETFSHLTFFWGRVWAKSSVTCHFDIIPLYSYWVAVFCCHFNRWAFHNTINFSLRKYESWFKENNTSSSWWRVRHFLSCEHCLLQTH
jgi:hypothetical protein